MILLGDIHGDFDFANKLAAKHPSEKVIQIGDFGIGFNVHTEPSTSIVINVKTDTTLPTLQPNLFFIRGNHDNPFVCRAHPNYLGEYGYNEEHNMFFVSGADSIDRQYRTLGIDWWEEEELSMKQCMDVIGLYEKVKPEIVISHDGPQSIVEKMFRIRTQSRTRMCLNTLLNIHKPDKWFFGHHHCPKSLDIFRCVDINEVVYL